MRDEKPIILLVDNDKSFVARVESIFTHLGHYRVQVAGSFDKALAALKQTSERIVVFVALPLFDRNGHEEKDGFALLKHLSKTERNRTLSYGWISNGNREDRIKALMSGAIHIYTKSDVDDLDWQALIDHIDNDVMTKLTDEATEATHDSRTGLLRINTFNAIVEAELNGARAEIFSSDSSKKRALRHPRVYTLVALDMDDFKLVNDNHGQSSGDKALAAVGEVVRELVRPDDYPCRSGEGDELLILLSGADQAAAQERCRELEDAVCAIEITDQKEVRVSLAISCGVATLLTQDIGQNIKKTWADLKELADQDLKQVKKKKKVGR